MVYPVPTHTRVTCEYGRKGSAWATGEHGGIDYGAPRGTTLVAPWGGRIIGVSSKGKESGTTWGTRAYGNHVIIDFDRLPDGRPGLWGVLAHMEEVTVTNGQRVEAGDKVGRVGDSGNAAGTHCHFEVQGDDRWARGNYRDPQPWIDAGKAPAKPVEPQYTAEIDSSLLGSGQPADGKPRATLKELQHRLNGISLKGGRTLPITGVFDAATEHEVQLWQQQKCGDKPDPDGRVSLGPKQRTKMFPTPPYTIVDKGLPPALSGGTGTAEPEWATRMRRALQRVTATVDYRPRWTDPAIAGKHTWNPSWVLLHHTAGTNSLRWIESGADHPPVPAAHFLIDRDGTVHVFSCHETYHAGNGGPLGDVPADRMNSYAWGIEIESEGKVFDFTPEQIQSTRELCAGLVEHCGVVASTEPNGPWQIVNHSTWNHKKTDTRQPDPWWREQITAEGTTPPPPPTEEETPVTTINVGDLRHGTKNSASVAWWQRKLNAVKLVGGSTLLDTGNYLDRTKRETALWQAQKADDKSVTDGNRVTPAQVRQMDPSVVLVPTDDSGGSSSTGGSSKSQLIYYKYLGKPKKPRDLKTSYTRLDENPDYGRFEAPEEGLLLSMCYVNVTWRNIPGATAQWRVRMMRRNPDDGTAHQDYTVGKINTVKNEFVGGKVWFGWADKNRAYEWEVDSAGFDGGQMNTRYTKWALIPQRTLERVARAMGLPVEAVITAIVQIFRMLADSEMNDATAVDLRDDPDDDGPVPAESVAP